MLIEKQQIALNYALCGIFMLLTLPAVGEENANLVQTRALLIKKLDNLRKQGKGAEVIGCCSQILRFDPRCAYAYRVRGLTDIQLGRSSQGVLDLRHALDLGDKSSEAYAYLAQGLIDTKNLTEAMDALDQGVKVDPKNVYLMRQRGELYGEMKDYPKAYAAFAKAVQLDPEIPDNYISLGHIHFKAGEFQKAVDDYSTAIKINPADLRLFGYRATAYQKLGKLDQYRADIKKANTGVFDF